MIKKRLLTRGIIYECITSNIPFVLAGSIRDDGPIPDVVTDIVEAQRQYKRIFEECKNGFDAFYDVAFYCCW